MIPPERNVFFFHFHNLQQVHYFLNYLYNTSDPSSITITLPSEVQTLLNPYSFLASFNFPMGKELSVTNIFVVLNFLFVMEIFLLYLPNSFVMAQTFLCGLFLFPIAMHSISDGWISSPSCTLIMLIGIISVSLFHPSSTPCIRTHFPLEYCSCSSTCTESILTLSVDSLTCVCTLVVNSSLVFLPFCYL